MNARSLPRIKTELVAEKVRRAIRQYVLSGSIEPGTQLVESQLAEQLGVSRAPVREALQRLESEGLVEYVPGKGVTVPDITEEDLREIYKVRSALEAVAMGLAVERVDADDLTALSSMLEAMQQAAAEGDAERVSAIDLELHEKIWEISGNRRLQRLLTSMADQIQMFLALNTSIYEDLLDNCLEHETLLAALSSGSVKDAEQLMVDHIDDAGERTISYLKSLKHRA